MTRTDIFADYGRFITAGVINTLLTFLVYQALLFALDAFFAYGLAWLFGFVFMICLYPSLAFPKSYRSKPRLIVLSLVYVTVFLTGSGVISSLIHTGISPRYAILITIVVTSTLNFFLTRLTLRGRWLLWSTLGKDSELRSFVASDHL
jgi:hypothetical protein